MLEVVSEITKMAKSGDVIITLGAGDIGSLGEPILQSLADR
jgi:UDP-N-acetylmuramate--alanine ligase